jgi:hypothetical protein
LILRNRKCNLFFLLFDQEFLHRVLLIVVLNEFLEFLLLLEQRSALLSVGIAAPSPAVMSAIVAILFALGNSRIAHQPGDIISLLLVIPALVACVVHTQQTP